MKTFHARMLSLLLAGLPLLAFAQSSAPALPQQFRDAAEETRFHQLTGELRCVMCQNQSLADSNAQIAHDLRREVLDLMHQGKTDQQIKDFLVERYGEFVLYKPQMEKRTWLLWFGPFVLLLLGVAIMVRVLRRQPRNNDVPTDDTQEW
ncbi:MAG: cytochrome c-type biogenesis protein CcmH [Pseudoxanthomonas sp.]